MIRTKQTRKKVMLAYSGGLDTTCILLWLQENDEGRNFDVVTYSANIGGEEDLNAIARKAKKFGAVHSICENLCDTFALDYIFPLLRSQALYEGQYHLGTALARPLIARRQIELCREHGCSYISHGATGLGNDQLRFELIYHVYGNYLFSRGEIDKKPTIIVPWRHENWPFRSRQDLVAYARTKGLNVETEHSGRPKYSVDMNLFHTSIEGNCLEDPWENCPDNMHDLKIKEPLVCTISFHEGDPVAIACADEPSVSMSPVALLKFLNKEAGERDIGTIDCVESRILGTKSRGIYKTPAGTVILAAHRSLEPMILEHNVISLKEQLMPRYARLVYEGLWFSHERMLLQGLFDESQKFMNGDVRVCLKEGRVEILARQAPSGLYRQASVSFDSDATSSISYKKRDGRLSSKRPCKSILS